MADTVTITPNQTFKHGRETYKEGKEYDVSAADAAYFEHVGWVGGEQAPAESATLDVHDSYLGHAAEVK